MTKVDLIFWGVGGRTLFIINYKMGHRTGKNWQASKISEAEMLSSIIQSSYLINKNRHHFHH